VATSSVREPGSIEAAQLSVTYTENEDGWVTAQVVEYPAAISQGDEFTLTLTDEHGFGEELVARDPG
jgi:hypothetical protein